jgi:hypothetical protein
LGRQARLPKKSPRADHGGSGDQTSGDDGAQIEDMAVGHILILLFLFTVLLSGEGLRRIYERKLNAGTG